jgi:hypothetical protein
VKQAFVHLASPRFWKLYNELPEVVRLRADKNFALVKRDPLHPSLHFKNLKDNLWSARIGMSYRAMALSNENGIDWVWIGHHGIYDAILRSKKG